MFLKDYELIKQLHEKYKFKGPLIEPGGLERPSIADYEISKEKAYKVDLELGENKVKRTVMVPHENQRDRYKDIVRPWSFIDKYYLIENPEQGGKGMEELPDAYEEEFETVICTSVFEHITDPFECSDALFEIMKPGGYLINCAPFLFPRHDAVDNWRFSPEALKYIHEKSGFEWLEGDFHINYGSADGIGDYHNADQHQAIVGCYALCRKP